MGKSVKRFISKAIIVIIVITIIPTFNNETYAAGDNTAPLLTGVRISQNEVTKPGVLSVYFDFVEEGLGLKEISVYIASETYWTGIPVASLHYGNGDKIREFTGTQRIDCLISSTLPSGSYYIERIVLIDKANNQYELVYNPQNIGCEYLIYDSSTVEKSTSYSKDAEGRLMYPRFDVVDEFDISFETGIKNPNLITYIKNMPEGGAGKILYDSKNSIFPKAGFDAIKGKDKTIILYNEGTQWIFNGLDIIKATKNINLKVSIKNIEGTAYGLGEKLVAMKFASNGTLPGKAQIRFKSDYLYSKSNISGKLYLYYMKNESTGNVKLEKTNYDLIFDGSDKWCHLTVTHNSKFLVSSKTLKKSPKPPKMKIAKVKMGKKKVTLSWKKQNRIKKYQISYKLKGKKKWKTKTINSSKKKFTIKKLKSKKTYYFKIRAYSVVDGKKYYSKYSGVKKIKIK